MSHAYTPGLQVKRRTRYRVTRLLPISGQVLVEQGQRVRAGEIVARTELPGAIIPVNLANALSLAAADVPGTMLKQIGETIEQGEPLARSRGIFGFFKADFHAPAAGTIETISDVTGQVILRGPPIPVEINAFVDGTVVETLPDEGVIVETEAAYVQGIFGVGGEQQGTLRVVTQSPQDDLTPDRLLGDLQGAAVIGGRRIHGETVALARERGVKALIAGGIDDQDLKEILGYDLGVAITGSESLGLSIVITEGFGEIAMAERTFDLLRSFEGQPMSVNGATQIRAGVMRPEIVIPQTSEAGSRDVAARVGGGLLEVGSRVRLIRDPYFGELGTVAELPSEPQLLESGSKARVLEVDCQSGKRVVVPRANVEIVEE